MSHDPVVAFYRGEQNDPHGRSIEQIWGFTQTELEDVGDYLDWLFPMPAYMGSSAHEPRASDEAQAAFADDDELRARLRRSLDLMLAFYGLSRDGEQITRGESFESRRLGWLYPNDHNHSRLSQIVNSLAALGEPALARNLRDELVQIADDYGAHSVSHETRGRWAHLLEG